VAWRLSILPLFLEPDFKIALNVLCALIDDLAKSWTDHVQMPGQESRQRKHWDWEPLDLQEWGVILPCSHSRGEEAPKGASLRNLSASRKTQSDGECNAKEKARGAEMVSF
jgi:hypothetical protein